MTSKFLFTLITCTLLFTQSTTAQTLPREKNERPEKVYNEPKGHGLGTMISSTNGKGFGYRYWQGDLGFHVSFFPAAGKENKYYNVGLTGYKTLRQYNKSRIFAHVGAEYQYTSYKSYYYSYPYSSGHTVRTDGLNLGAGAGYGVHGRYVSIDFFLGYGAYIRNRTSSYPGDDDSVEDNTIITLSGGLAFFIEL
jgi:hypothetical protein